MTHIINWIIYHGYDITSVMSGKKESGALVDMGSRKNNEERKSISVHPS